MEHLPAEIARHIASELDIKSARCLARAGSGVREIGEMRLWKSVVVQPDLIIFEDEDHFASSLRRLLDNLESHPPRIDYLAELTLSLPPQTPGSITELLSVLRKVAGTIQHLHLSLPPLASGQLHHSERLIGHYHALLKRLAETVESWDKVIELRISVAGDAGLELVAPIIAACPRLRALMLQPLGSAVRPDRLSVVPRPNDAALPQLPGLLALTIVPLIPAHRVYAHLWPGDISGNVQQRYREIVDRVLPCTTGLENLIIQGPHPLDAAVIKSTIESLPKLKKLFIDIYLNFSWGSIAEIDSPLSVLWLKRVGLYGSRDAKSILSVQIQPGGSRRPRQLGQGGSNMKDAGGMARTARLE